MPRPWLSLVLALPALAETAPVERAPDVASKVVVLANGDVADSVAVAKHYMEVRGIPAANLLLVRTTGEEVLTWPELREQVLKPAARFLEKKPEVLYIVPVWGIPSRVSEENPENDAPKDEPDNTLTKFVTNRDYGCVDAELALIAQPGHDIEGWIDSEVYGREEHVTAAHRLFMVSRLDGPTPAIAAALADRAMYAETYGLVGDAWLDARGLDPKTPLGETDLAIRNTAQAFSRAEIGVHLDEAAAAVDVSTFKDCAFYWGWTAPSYTGTAPFTFRPGAVAAHLHSSSAASIRTDSKYWVGPLLAHGAACTAGTVYEPLIPGFPDMGLVLDRFLKGYTWGEACAMGNRKLSWQAVFVGDPLYAPFAKGLKEAQAADRALATDGYAKAAAAIDAGDLDGAQAVLDGVRRIAVPMEGARDLSFLAREIASRRVTKAVGTIDDLSKRLEEARISCEKGDDKTAQAALEKALALSPGSFDANLAMGTLLLANDRTGQALPCLEKARKAIPAAPGLAEPLGRALAANGKFAEAIPLLQDAVTAGAGADALAALGDCYLKTKQAARAIEFLTAAAKKDPKNRAALVALARAHEENKDLALALATLKDAVRIYPESADDIRAYKDAWKALSNTAIRTGDKREKENAAWVVNDFDNPEYQPPSAGVALEIVKQADAAAGSEGVVGLGTIPAEAMTVPGLPRLVIGNASGSEIRIYLKGSCARQIPLKPLAGAAGKEYGVFPGVYEVIVVVTKEKDRTVLTTWATFELNKKYGMVMDNSLAMMFPAAK